MQQDTGADRRAVLIDLYDTLVEVDPRLLKEGRERLAAALGVGLQDLQQAWRLRLQERFLGRFSGVPEMMQALAGDLDRTLTLRQAQALAADDTATVTAASHLYPGAREFLVETRSRGWRVGLVSNASQATRRVLEALDLPPLLDAVVLSCEVGVAKPDPGIYQAAADRLGFPPAACWFVGDGASRELVGASALGMRTIRVVHPHQDAGFQRELACDYECAAYEEILALLSPGPG